MAAVKPESHSAVLEDDFGAVLPEPKVVEGEEFVDLDTPEEKPEPAKKAEAPAPKAAEKPAPAPAADDDLPEDLKGKTPAQIAKMLKDAQSLIGRQGNELGEFRRKADLLIQASLANLAANKKAEPEAAKVPPAAEEIDDTEFFANPKAAIAKALENNPVIKEIRETLGKAAADSATQKATEATARFNQAHPDAAEIMASPEFREWVNASRVRTALLHRAHTKFDFDAGDEVFGTWKALKGVKAAPRTEAETTSDTSEAARTLAAAAKKKREQALKDAATPTGGGGTKEAGAKKIYRRADVLRLMEEQPERYEALAPEIELAYREGRVR